MSTFLHIPAADHILIDRTIWIQCMVLDPVNFAIHKALLSGQIMRCLAVGEPNEGRWIGCMVRKTLEDIIEKPATLKAKGIKSRRTRWLLDRKRYTSSRSDATADGCWRQAVWPQTGLSHLRRAHIRMFQSAMGVIPIKQIKPFYQLPSMESLKGTDGYR